MKNEIIYRNYHVSYQYGYYWIEGCKNPYDSFDVVKETIDFWEENNDFND